MIEKKINVIKFLLFMCCFIHVEKCYPSRFMEILNKNEIFLHTYQSFLRGRSLNFVGSLYPHDTTYRAFSSNILTKNSFNENGNMEEDFSMRNIVKEKNIEDEEKSNNKTKYLITSSLPYINGIKHLGNLVGSMLPADVYARFLRAQKYEVLYICGTDEHGTPAEIAAQKAGLSPEEFCERQHYLQDEIYKKFYLSFDYFGRTSSKENYKLTQECADKLEKNKFIVERSILQMYSKEDKRFLPDRYILGTCPHCGSEDARGDQCEQCSTMLDPTDLIKPRSALSGSTDLELRETNHLFLRFNNAQENLEYSIKQWISQHPDWPKIVTSLAETWIKAGLRERCITRDLKWGVPVLKAGFEDKVFYVWFDAPIGYISITQQWAHEAPDKRDWEKWWTKELDNTHYTQFMAKDNIPFHTITFPATLLGTKEPWKQADFIKGISWLNYYGKKFSTSHKRGIFMDKALELFPADYWRFYLLENIPESSDTSFTWEAFSNSVNKSLSDILGNYVNRCLAITEKNFGLIIPAGGTLSEKEEHLIDRLQKELEIYNDNLSKLNFRKSTETIKKIWGLGNEYINDAAPWKLMSLSKEKTAMTLRTSINLIRIFAILSEPYIPQTAEKLYKSFFLNNEEKSWPINITQEIQKLEPNRHFIQPGILFKKISADEVKAYEEEFDSH